MGELEGWSQMGGGAGGWASGGGGRILPNGLLPNAGSLVDTLDSERWLMAEEKTAELITCIQPNQPSEERRNAVADYVQRLIMKCFPCQVFTFGSVPLKTYLPDGDIDLTVFSNNPNLKDSWASEVCDLLKTEEKNENAEFHVKEVQYIQAEVKIIKCLVENIVVDISFNQLGGLCTLCFLEEVDHLINHNHLFKRSIILIKAWCYYESRILGAHHGLISTYALETLVLYIFHVFNNSFAGPLEVLYRFLEFFSCFDWDNFCVSLWGPVPINSLPDVTAEPPRKDSGELLLNKLFLDACSSAYAVIPGGQDNQWQPFTSKHFNVVDPLRVSNNLGRSVSKGNFFRIRSAFVFGAKKLARFLDCPKENVVAEVTKFFTNTWDRHGSGIRPDAPITDSLVLKIDSRMSDSVDKKSESGCQDSDFDHTQTINHQSWISPKTPDVTPGHANQGQRSLKSGLLVNDIQRSLFARTRSSPELTDTYQYALFQGTHNKPPENGKTHNKNKNVELEIKTNQPSSLHHAPPHSSLEPSTESNMHHHENMNQEEQDLVNMMASSGFHGFNGPLNFASGNSPFPISPSFLASLGYTQRNMAGMIPTNMPFIDPQFPGMQFPHGLVPHYFPGVNVPSNSEDLVNENNLGSRELNSVDDNYNHNLCGEPNRVNSEIVPQDDDKPQSSSAGMNYIPPPRRVGGSGGLVRGQHKNNKEKQDRLRDSNHLDQSLFQGNKLNDAYSDELATSSRSSSAARSNSLRSKTSSEGSRDETSTVNKSTKEKRGKKTVNHIRSRTSDRFQSGEDDQEWVPSMSFGSESETQTVAPMHVPSHGPDNEPAQTSGSSSSSIIPLGPMFIASNLRHQMMENSGGPPLTFYLAGPPVPFFTMLPFSNVPPENGSTDASVSRVESMENGDIGQNFHHEGVDKSVDFSPRGAGPGEHKSDILNSDFSSHWQNLQFGRFCQSPRHHGPSIYPSPVMVPPVYIQGRVPWDGPGRPFPNMNGVTQLMNYGPRLVPVAPLQSGPNRPPNVYQHFVEDLPRYRTGTGTYLPNPKIGVRDRPWRGNFNHDRSDNHGDKDSNSKSRASGRNQNHNRNQTDKSRLDRSSSSGSRSINSHRHDSFSTNQTQNGVLQPGSSQSGPANVGYGMYPLSAVPSNGSNGPAVVMVYPFEQNADFSSQNEQLEFGSLGPTGFSGVNEQSPHGEGSRSRGMLEEHRLFSPDQPSSPHHQRRL